MSQRLLHAVSLFSNCGAGDVGYRQAGFRFAVMAELDQHRLDVALLNHPGATGVPGDLRDTLPTVTRSWRKQRGRRRPDLLAACPPCQGLSSAYSDRGSHDDVDGATRDHRNLLVTVIASAAEALRPRVVVVENVAAFLTRQVRHPATGEPVSAARYLVDSLADYSCFPALLDLADFGVPQTRVRAFLTFIRKSEPALGPFTATGRAPYPTPAFVGRQITVEEALKSIGLPSLDAASAATAKDPGRPLHSVPVWSLDRYRMVAAIPPGTGASAWDNSRCCSCGEVAVDQTAASCPSCAAALPRPVVRDDDGKLRLIRGFRASSYARLRLDRPAATITTASGNVGSDRTLHPTENRVLSILECAHLQTLPADFDWGDSLRKKGPTNVRSMIGEAVPPLFTAQHGRVLAALIRGRPPEAALAADDPRSARALAKLALMGSSRSNSVGAVES